MDPDARTTKATAVTPMEEVDLGEEGMMRGVLGVVADMGEEGMTAALVGVGVMAIMAEAAVKVDMAEGEEMVDLGEVMADLGEVLLAEGEMGEGTDKIMDGLWSRIGVQNKQKRLRMIQLQVFFCHPRKRKQ